MLGAVAAVAAIIAVSTGLYSIGRGASLAGATDSGGDTGVWGTDGAMAYADGFDVVYGEDYTAMNTGDGAGALPEAGEHIQWLSYYVESNTLVPVLLEADEGSVMAGSLKPGAVVYGYDYHKEWVCITDAQDRRFYVKAEYVAPFSKAASAISLFRDDLKVINGQFTTYSEVQSISGMTMEDITNLLLPYPALQGLEESVLLYEKEYGINAYFILSVASQESGYGTSSMAQRKNNFFGIGAYDDSAYASALTFDTKAECVEYFCVLIARYVEGGRGTPTSINSRYASDKSWAGNVVHLMNRYASQVAEGREGAG